jgi:hypothetical protein
MRGWDEGAGMKATLGPQNEHRSVDGHLDAPLGG